MPSLSLRIKPLLAFRPMHALTRANMDLQVTTFPIGNRNPGFLIRPYNALPPLYVRTEGAKGAFYPSPDWCRNVNYLVEEERGFPCEEDLFLPGVLSLELRPGGTVYFAASAGAGEITESLAGLWEEEAEQRACLADAAAPQEHLRLEGTRFLIRPDQEEENGALAPKSGASDIFEPSGVVAGYHWFDVWGRDSLIALPGLTFAAGRAGEGEAVLAAISKAASNGLVPNMFARGSRPAAYNSVDASLWYVWAVQQMLIWAPGRESFVRDVCWPVIRSIVEVYRDNSRQAGPEGAPRLPLWADEEGMLHAGNAETQLTWMDATARGRPVTPRHGCPVEINALWYNAVAFADDLARRYDEPGRRNPDYARMRAVFRSRFWTPRHGGHLGDVWRDGVLDTDVRPNQIFAVAVPYSPLDEDDQPFVVESVRNHLLTPYGLRSLSPRAAAYQGRYEGGPDQRDEAYHQGTVWPWLLGSYAEALLKTAWDIDGAVRALLNTLSPLFSSHLADAGLGSLSEIFDGNPPHAPNGCIAQAWSVAECYRMLRMLEKAAPRVYAEWETLLSGR